MNNVTQWWTSPQYIQQIVKTTGMPLSHARKIMADLPGQLAKAQPPQDISKIDPNAMLSQIQKTWLAVKTGHTVPPPPRPQVNPQMQAALAQQAQVPNK